MCSSSLARRARARLRVSPSCRRPLRYSVQGVHWRLGWWHGARGALRPTARVPWQVHYRPACSVPLSMKCVRVRACVWGGLG
jgi:hypothetical protein